MRGVRAQSNSRATLISRRASGAPRQRCGPRPNARWRSAPWRSHPEVVGIVSELDGIVICGCETHHDPGASRNVELADLRVDLGNPTVAQHAAVETQDLLGRVRYQLGFSQEPLPLVAVPEERQEAIAQRTRCRLLTCQCHRIDDVDDVGLVQLLRPLAREADQVAREVLVRFRVTGCYVALHIFPHGEHSLGGRDLVFLGRSTIGQQRAGITPLLQDVGIRRGKAEQVETSEAGKREREPLHEVDDGFISKTKYEVLRVRAKTCFQ